MGEYCKAVLTHKEQIDLLEKEGLLVDDRSRVGRHLSNVGYYRLSTYMLPFRQMKNDGILSDDFKSGTTWNNIYDIYKFDRKLRLLVFDAIERIEIALRSQITYQLSHKYGSHWHNKSEIFQTTVNPKKCA